MKTQDIFKIVRQLIINAVDELVYPKSVITQGYQAPVSNNFIVFYLMPVKNMNIKPVNEHTDITQTITTLYNNLIQVDFYSDDRYNSIDNISSFNLYLHGLATDYLLESYKGVQIGQVHEIYNNTDEAGHFSIQDKGKFLHRYTLRFELYTNSKLTTEFEPVTYKLKEIDYYD